MHLHIWNSVLYFFSGVSCLNVEHNGCLEVLVTSKFQQFLVSLINVMLHESRGIRFTQEH